MTRGTRQKRRRDFKIRHAKGWELAKHSTVALLSAQAMAVVAVYAEDRMRMQRIPGGVHGFPTLPPADTPVADTVVRSYTEGNSLYRDMLEAIEQAQHHIYFETFIWRSDQWGYRFKKALYAAAKRGVEVYLVYDGFGVLNQNPLFKIFPHHPHMHVRQFPTIRTGLLTFDVRRTGRDHCKILLVDSHIGFVGGYNIGDAFANEWRDTHVRLIGPATHELEKGFIDFWNHFKPLREPKLPDVGPKHLDAPITAAFNQPNRLLFPVRGLYLDAIDAATDQILITQAYFIPDREILHGLITAARRGVAVKVLIPEYSNHILADWVARPYYGALLREGIEIWLYQHAMIHSKTMTIDGHWSTVGTANIDRLSLRGNFEVNVQFDSPAFAQRMEDLFRNDLTASRQLTWSEWSHRSIMTRILEKLLHPFEFMV